MSSKQLTAFSDWRTRSEDPDFLSATRYVQYLSDYCTEFELWPNIHLEKTVVSVKRRPGGGHVVTYRSRDGTDTEWECDAVAVCSGLHVTPNIPSIPGVEHVPSVFHSADFKGTSQFGVDKTLMILGSGETAMDLGYLGVISPTKRVIMCHRDGFFSAPKVTFTGIRGWS